MLILAAVLAVLIGVPVAAFLWMTSVPGRSHSGPLPPLGPEQKALALRLELHVRAIASVPHNVAHPAELERSAAYLERTLAGLGYEVQSQPFRAGGVPVRNIEIVIEPADAGAETLVVGAHYDSAFDAPGANDNGTGSAAVLELARMLANLQGRAKLRIRLVLFVNEEPPFFQTEEMGSLVYARALRAKGERVMGMMSLETMGYYSDAPGSQRYPSPLGLRYPTTGNFIAFVGMTSSRRFVRKAVRDFRELSPFPSVGGTAPGSVPGIAWSDHWSFERMGWPALMVTDSAPFRYPHYHTRQDTPDKVDYERLARVVTGLEAVIRRWASE